MGAENSKEGISGTSGQAKQARAYPQQQATAAVSYLTDPFIKTYIFDVRSNMKASTFWLLVNMTLDSRATIALCKFMAFTFI